MRGKKLFALCLALTLVLCSACGGGSAQNSAAAGDTAASSAGGMDYNSGGAGMDMELYEPSAPQESQSASTAEGAWPYQRTEPSRVSRPG